MWCATFWEDGVVGSRCDVLRCLLDAAVYYALGLDSIIWWWYRALCHRWCYRPHLMMLSSPLLLHALCNAFLCCALLCWGCVALAFVWLVCLLLHILVMQQWCNSDATVMQQCISWWGGRDVLGCLLLLILVMWAPESSSSAPLQMHACTKENRLTWWLVAQIWAISVCMRYDLLRRVPNLIKTLSLLYEVASILADALDDLVHFRYPLAHLFTFGTAPPTAPCVLNACLLALSAWVPWAYSASCLECPYTASCVPWPYTASCLSTCTAYTASCLSTCTASSLAALRHLVTQWHSDLVTQWTRHAAQASWKRGRIAVCVRVGAWSRVLPLAHNTQSCLGSQRRHASSAGSSSPR